MNILACKLYTVRDHTSWFCDRTSDTHIESNYDQMRHIMIDSAFKHITDLDSVVTHTGTVDSIQDAFRNHLTECYKLWQDGHTVLSADLDVVFLKPAEWFKGNQFEMYAHTDPASNAEFNHYLNCGVKLFPSSLSQTFWDELFDSYKTWDNGVYDHEQRVLNRLFWAQGSEADLLKTVDHRKVYQLLQCDLAHPQNWIHNKCLLSNAVSVHVHGSRGSGDRLSTMKLISEHF